MSAPEPIDIGHISKIICNLIIEEIREGEITFRVPGTIIILQAGIHAEVARYLEETGHYSPQPRAGMIPDPPRCRLLPPSSPVERSE